MRHLQRLAPLLLLSPLLSDAAAQAARLTVAKAKPSRQRWTIEDAMGGTIELLGPWTTRMHKEKTECEAQMSAEGEPALTHQGDRFTLAKKKAAQ